MNLASSEGLHERVLGFVQEFLETRVFPLGHVEMHENCVYAMQPLVALLDLAGDVPGCGQGLQSVAHRRSSVQRCRLTRGSVLIHRHLWAVRD